MSRLGWFGVFVTAAYIGAFWWLFGAQISQIKTLQPNELGDFFAGVFGPVALFWVVLGFFQQGVELRHSVETLKLQAEELKNSVEQQRELVKVSRDQIEFDRQAIDAQNVRYQKSIRPDFYLQAGGGMFRGDGHSKHGITILNRGEIATDVRIIIHPKPISLVPMSFTSIGRGDSKKIDVVFLEKNDRECNFILEMNFVDTSGSENIDKYDIRLHKGENDHWFHNVKIERLVEP